MRTRVPLKAVTALVAAGAAGVALTGTGVAGVPSQIGHPTKALCKKGSSPSTYKIGWETFSQTQQFAAAFNKNMAQVAKQLGCVTIIQMVDNSDGPTAVNNVRTMVNEGIKGLANFNIVGSANVEIEKLVKQNGISAISTGATMPSTPYLGFSNYQAGYSAGQQLAQAAKKRYPSQKAPYLLNATDAATGAGGVAQGKGTVNAFKKAFPKVPASHIINVTEDSSEPVAYNNTLSALSNVPGNQLILMTGNDTDVVYGMFQAARARKRAPFLAEDTGGSPLAFQLICKYSQYVGSIADEPQKWGEYMIPAVMEEMNGVKLPSFVNIPTVTVTKATDTRCH